MTEHRTGIRPSIRRAIQQLIQEGKFSINTKPAEIFAIWDRPGPITNGARTAAHDLIRDHQHNLGLNFLRQCSCGQPQYNNYKIQATIDFVQKFKTIQQAQTTAQTVLDYLVDLGLAPESKEQINKHIDELIKIYQQVQKMNKKATRGQGEQQSQFN
jgi:hypothetical protein